MRVQQQRGLFRAVRRNIGAGVLVGLVTALGLAATSADAQAEGTLEQVRAAGELRVAGLVYPPYIMRRPDGSYDGVDPDILAVLAERLGVRLRFVDSGWDTAVAGLTTNKWDLVPSLCTRPERDKVIDFTQAYFFVGHALGVRKDSTIDSIEAANDPSVTFGQGTGSAGEAVAKKEFPKAQLKSFTNAGSPEMAQELLSGRIDAALFDAPITTNVLVSRYGDRIRFIPSADEPFGGDTCPAAYGYREADAEWGQYLNDFLDEMRSSGKLAELTDKWMTEENVTIK